MMRIVIAFVSGVVLTYMVFGVWEHITVYGSAEPLHPIAQQFGRSLAERIAREERSEPQ